MTEPSLFDDHEGGGTCLEGDGVSPAHLPRSEWTEVPGAVFLAWSQAQQLDYCARRDEDSAAHEDDPQRKAFFLERAAWYRQEIIRSHGGENR